MAKYRYLQCDFWRDADIQEYTLSQKYMYIYILTNENTTQCGIYQISMKQMVFETNLQADEIRKLLNDLQSFNKIRYNPETKEIAVKNWGKYNWTSSPKVQKCIMTEFERVKDRSLIPYVIGPGNRDIFEDWYEKDVFMKSVPKGEKSEKEKEKDDDDNDNGPSSGNHGNMIELSYARGIDRADIPNDKKKEERIDKKEIIKEKEKEEKEKETELYKVYDQKIKCLSQTDADFLQDWLRKVEPDVIYAAIDEGVKYNKRSLGYIKAILKAWYEKGVVSMDRLKKYREDYYLSAKRKFSQRELGASASYIELAAAVKRELSQSEPGKGLSVDAVYNEVSIQSEPQYNTVKHQSCYSSCKNKVLDGIKGLKENFYMGVSLDDLVFSN